ncbi:cytosolic phospholipase A2-like [Dendronephthya gigantea]|uniref:cytosolic phospholipase A2-like n=1 Tax=Dendronephthya gigantea TaxID=151771 RepID=UPI001068E88F|nr:cytosolic phospholipase A2-like [Dendronephthya gigantea]
MEHLEIKEENVKVLQVKVVKATGVSVGGYFGDWETPDPYVMLRVRSSPNAKQTTTTKRDDVNPVWNEDFEFYLNPEQKNVLEVIMMDADFGFDDKIGNKKIDVDGLLENEKMDVKIGFNEKTTLELSLLVINDDSKELRFSYDISDEEKDFLKKRDGILVEKFAKIGLGEKTPKSQDEVPVIAIMGSGGGYRAACGLSGVMVALQESGIFDCATYIAGLSGSSWYISSLYMHDGWPDKISCRDMADDLKERFNTPLLSHFHFDFKRRMDEKAKGGQPVRFTDFFGMAIGDALLPNQESKLSFQDSKIKYGEVPLPITTGIRVCKDVAAGAFSEWVEFTPYEYGSAKYGVFGKTEHFGGKYYKGRLVKKYKETPLHYLQGIWGSAFSIILDSMKSPEKKTEEQRQEELVKAVLEDAGRCKTDEHDSEDEELPEDEMPSENWVTEMLNPFNIFSSRRGKAAECFNFCRGLKFKSQKNPDFDYDNHTSKDKTICVVDSGIAFNSPFPAILRPERKVELILSFDFSQRDGGDKELPFKELMKAEEWAKQNGHPFPQIKGNPITKDTDIRECYIFENKKDISCPIVMHFPIVNKTFRKFVKPGVPRKTQEEKDFANFDIFDDPEQPYSSFTFEYEPKTFERMHELMKFNTLLNVDAIKEKIAYYVGYRRNNPKYAKK